MYSCWERHESPRRRAVTSGTGSCTPTTLMSAVSARHVVAQMSKIWDRLLQATALMTERVMGQQQHFLTLG